MPGSEGNLASDLENQEQTALDSTTPVEEKAEGKTPETKPSENAKVAADGKPADARPVEQPTAVAPPAAPPQHGPGHRKRPGHGGGQPGQKNGGSTLDLVELKDMS